MTRTVTMGDRELTRIGLGTNRLTDTPADRAFLEAAAQTELNFIDTAHLYTGGESEATVGSVLSPEPPGVTIATKGGYEPGVGLEGLRSELEQSFERLRAETIDLYYLHRVDPEIPVEESMGLIKEYRDAGRIEHVGISEVTVEQIERARAVVPVAAVQNEYHLGERKHDEVVDHCAREGIVFVAYYPLKRDDPPALEAIAAKHGATGRQIKLAWLLRRDPVVLPIPGTRSLDHLRENLGALDIELPDEDFEALRAA